MGSAPSSASASAPGPLRARYRRILRFAAPFLIQEWWYEVFLPRVGLARLSRRGRLARFQRIARDFHALAVELGGLMIKVGQFLSARLDVLPPEITDELKSLQDEVPAVPFGPIRTLAEEELGVPLERAYGFFDPTPVAAASLGQAHRARLRPDDAALAGFEDVIVKVQRPGIGGVVDTDLAALRWIARKLQRVSFIRERVDLLALLDEFAAITRQEIDYLHEAAGAERMLGNFADDPRVSGPCTAWERTTRRVLTLSDVTAIKIDDIDALRAAGIDPAKVADTLAAVMLDQLFTDGFFHADPHPGNIFVTPTPDTEPGFALTFVDFGMMGEIPDALRRGLQRALVAIATRNAHDLVAAMHDTGMLLPAADSSELEKAMAELFDRFGGMAVADLQNVDAHDLQAFARHFGEVVRATPIQLPQNLLFVFRAVSLMSGVCTALNPEFNVWRAVDPYAKGLATDGRGMQAILRQVAQFARDAVALPRRVGVIESRLDGIHPVAPVAHRPRSRLAPAALVSAALIVASLIVRRRR